MHNFIKWSRLVWDLIQGGVGPSSLSLRNVDMATIQHFHWGKFEKEVDKIFLSLRLLLKSLHGLRSEVFPNPLCTVVPPIPPPPNTAAHFQFPNKGFVGYIWLRIPPISEYRGFFVSPEISGIGRLTIGAGGATVFLTLTISGWIIARSCC